MWNLWKFGKKVVDSFECVLVKGYCWKLVLLKVKKNEIYLIIVDLKLFKKIVRYVVKVIVLWNRKFRDLIKKSNVCKGW